MKNNKLVWAAQVILLIGFLVFGIGKFIQTPEQAAPIFGQIGGTTSQYLVGSYETISAILVIIPTTAYLGAILIIVSMIIAILLHIFVIGFEGSLAFLPVISIIFILLAWYVMKHRKKDFLKKR